MSTVLGIMILLVAVVAANILHLVWPRFPLAIYQIIVGVILAIIPDLQTFRLEPEIFMLLIIAPLMFNDGQNTSFRQLARGLSRTMSMAVYLALFTVIVMSLGLHLLLPHSFSLPVAFMLAAIITPTDAVAVKSLTTRVEMPENVNLTLEHESLFNDASGIVLFSLASSALSSGNFSLAHGVWTFVYVFFGGIIFGLIIGSLLINIRTRLMQHHVDIASIVIPINIMTPIVIYWLAEELHLSGILAVVAVGIMHSILYDRLHLTSTKVQIATTTIWTIIADALNGLVFVFLGLSLPSVLAHMRQLQTLKITGIALVLYLVMTVLRYCWSQWGFVRLHSKALRQDQQRDSLLLAIGGVHGTITMAMAFSIPLLVNEERIAMRNALILIAAFVILISLIVGTFGFPKLLPPKKESYSKAEFHQALTDTVQYAITELNNTNDQNREKSLVIDQLASQMSMRARLKTATYNRLLQRCHQVELDTLEELTDNDIITPQQERAYSRLMARDVLNRSNHGFLNIIIMLYHRLHWLYARHKIVKLYRQHPELKKDRQTHFKTVNDQLGPIMRIVIRRINKFLNEEQTPQNAYEIAAVRRTYLNRYRFFSKKSQIDADIMTNYFVDAFQSEHSYIQQQAAAHKISSDLANALNEQISTDQLVYMQSLD
ncbi:sodium:proton antiporter [uncultured Limosilactobacillus sp.]|uniref:cation:proton antiporter n=1 Tax=uncultured Limosilactobacillus sp. TaxID=2837629 RepID=UPI0025EB7001|nr:sodium:proton antiporter [uncultured Limosilactobacillus sp.]